MEVHHHTPTPRKTWSHYFWEFLMLFLAVFCGFLAENEREHFVERRREGQYMKSMLEDLKLDTAELTKWERIIYNTIYKHMDTSLAVLFLREPTDSDIVHCYKSIPVANRVIDVVLEDRTSVQLKSSGNLRLIRHKAVTDGLAAYWASINKLEGTLQINYEYHRREISKLIFPMLNYDNYTNESSTFSIALDTKEPKLLRGDFPLRVELGNRIFAQRAQLNNVFRGYLTGLKRQANNLIGLIKEEYNLE